MIAAVLDGHVADIAPVWSALGGEAVVEQLGDVASGPVKVVDVDTGGDHQDRDRVDVGLAASAACRMSRHRRLPAGDGEQGDAEEGAHDANAQQATCRAETLSIRMVVRR